MTPHTSPAPRHTEHLWPLIVASGEGEVRSLNAAAQALFAREGGEPVCGARLFEQIRSICAAVWRDGTTSATLRHGGEDIPVFAERLPDANGTDALVALRIVQAPGGDEVYRRAFHASPNPIIITRLRDGVVIAANVAVERASGYSPGELIGRRTTEVRLWVDETERDRLLAGLRAHGRVHELDATMRHRTGELRVMAISAEIVEVGGEPCMITVAHDVTERKRVEQRERESRQRYQALMDNSPSVIFLKSVEGCYLVVNRTFERVLGVQADAIIGRDDTQIAPPEVAAAYRRDDQRLMAARAPITCDDLLVLPSGVRRFFTVKFPLFDEHGEIYAIGGIATDFTERHRAETELERKNEVLSVIRQSQAAFISGAESAQIFSDLLGAFLRLTGGRAGMVRDCLVKNGRQTLTIMAASGVRAAGDGGYVADGGIVRLPEGPLPDSPAVVSAAEADENAARWVSLPLVRRGKLIGVVDLLSAGPGSPEEVARSVDPLLQTCAVLIEAKHAEDERAQAVAGERALEAQLREAAKLQAIGTLAGGIAHDFNNILTGIFNGVDLARAELGAQHAVEPYLAGVMQSAQRAKHLVQQILTFSRRAEPRRVALSIRSSIREAAQFLRATLPASVQLTWRCEEELAVHGDPTQLQQVLLNLGTNAGYAMRRTGGSLAIEARRARLTDGDTGLAPGNYVRLTVRDTGEGMDAATRGRVFEPFFTTKPSGEGTGLGLAVVHGIVQAHEGAIAVHSAPGQGTEFVVHLPLVEAVVENHAPTAVQLPRGRNENIVWIDDESMVTKTGSLLLERLGYRVVVYNAAELAWAAISAAPASFDLVITDLAMPGWTGIDFVRRLRPLRPEARLILMTGYSGTLDEAGARDLGFSRLLMKPFSLEHLACAVREVLDGTDVV